MLMLLLNIEFDLLQVECLQIYDFGINEITIFRQHDKICLYIHGEIVLLLVEMLHKQLLETYLCINERESILIHHLNLGLSLQASLLFQMLD